MDISSGTPESVVLPAGNARLPGLLLSPPRPLGIVLLADVSGSTGCNPSTLFVAQALHAAQLASLAVNLLTSSEAAVDAHTGWLRHDPVLLAGRIHAARRWLAAREDMQDLPLGLFAAGPVSAAALVAARAEPAFKAVVCWPEPDQSATSEVQGERAPTLLVSSSESIEAVADVARRWFERHLTKEWLSAQAP